MLHHGIVVLYPPQIPGRGGKRSMVWLRVWCWEAKCGKGVGKSQKALLFFRYFLNNIYNRYIRNTGCEGWYIEHYAWGYKKQHTRGYIASEYTASTPLDRLLGKTLNKCLYAESEARDGEGQIECNAMSNDRGYRPLYHHHRIHHNIHRNNLPGPFLYSNRSMHNRTS